MAFFKDAEHGPRATVTLYSHTGLKLGATYYQRNEDCGAPQIIEAGFSSRKIVVPADREVTLLVGTGISYTCNIFLTFLAKAGNEYELDFYNDEARKKCFADVYVANKSAGVSNREKVDVRQREHND